MANAIDSDSIDWRFESSRVDQIAAQATPVQLFLTKINSRKNGCLRWWYIACADRRFNRWSIFYK